MKKHHIIFLPGMFAGGWIWNKVSENLISQGYTVTIIDHCISKSLGNSTKDSHAKLNQYLEQSPKDSSVILVGNSLGSLIAADFARYFPKKISGIVLSGSPGLNDVDWGVSVLSLKRGTPDAFRALTERIFYDQNRMNQEILDDIQENFNNHFVGILKWIRIINEYDMISCLEQIKCSIQLIWGAEDTVTLKDEWFELSDKLEHMNYTEISQSGHSPMVETPTEFSEKLLTYLTGVSNQKVVVNY